MTEHGIAVVIPCYKCRSQILDVLARVGKEVRRIYVIDDCCPEGTGKLVQDRVNDPRVRVLFNAQNLGVGGAVMRGYRAALEEKENAIIVKIDGDGQMDPALLSRFAAPLRRGLADYTKGNRFYNPDQIYCMPKIRIFGNVVLSFLSKFSTGYWQTFDFTNGYTAIAREVLRRLDMDKIDKRYFFESDMLFRLNIIRAVVTDIPMSARYGDEKSNLNIAQCVGRFFFKHCVNTAKRIFYNYFLRDLSLASLELLLGLLLSIWGCLFGGFTWINALANNATTPAGTAILAGTMIIVGLQLLLGFFAYDMANVPSHPLHVLYADEAQTDQDTDQHSQPQA
ncbi:MAG: glycosyltransferase family 2 protein [Desulfovibrio sp.]|nr:glycosyltransferase family 2 protein [Desulfovibrio sp.]